MKLQSATEKAGGVSVQAHDSAFLTVPLSRASSPAGRQAPGRAQLSMPFLISFPRGSCDPLEDIAFIYYSWPHYFWHFAVFVLPGSK